MAERGWPGHGLSMGWFEFRRTLRDIRRSKRQLVGIGFGVGMPLLGILAAWLLLRGNVPADFDPARYGAAGARGQLTAFWVFLAFLVANRTASIRPRADAQSLLLTTVSARTVTVGLWVAETLRVLAYVGTPAVVGALALTDLLGTPAALLTLPLATVLFVASGVTAGSLCGYLAVLAVARVPVVARYKTWLAGALSLAVMAVFLGAQTVFPAGPLLDVLASVPVGWLADVAALGIGVRADTTLAASGIVATLAVVAAGGRAIELATARFWYDSAVSPVADDAAEASPTGDDGRWLDGALDAALAPVPSPAVGSRRSGRVATMTVLHTIRNPRRLTVLVVPLFALGSSLVSSGVGSGGVGPTLAVGAAALLPWIPSAVFTLNPLGDQQAALPTTLTAVDARAFVRGVALPGLVYGLPLAVGLTALAGLATPLPPLELAGLVALAAFLTVAAAGVCPAVGVLLPRFSAISVGQADDVLPPRFAAVALSLALVSLPGGYLAALVVAPGTAQVLLAGLVGWVPAVVVDVLAGVLSLSLDGLSGWFSALAERIVGVETGAFRLGAAGVVVTAGVASAVAGYRYAVSTVQSFSLS